MKKKLIVALAFLLPFVLNAQKFIQNKAYFIDRIIGLDSINIYQYKLIKYNSKNHKKSTDPYYLMFEDNGKFESSDFGSTCGLDVRESISGNYQIIDNSHILLHPKYYFNSKKLSVDSLSKKSYLFYVSRENKSYIKLIESNGNIKSDHKNAILSKILDKKVSLYINERRLYEFINYKPQSKDNISRVNEYIKNVFKKNPNDYQTLFTAWYPENYLVNMVYSKKTKKTILIINYIAKNVENGMGKINIK